MLRTSVKSSLGLQPLSQLDGTGLDGTGLDDNVSATTLATAQRWLDNLNALVAKQQLDWLDPLVNPSPNGEIVLEWWHGSRKLTIYIDSDSAEYVQVWGADIDREMADGSANQASDVETLWRWLVG
jgi:hypothetical protein